MKKTCWFLAVALLAPLAGASAAIAQGAREEGAQGGFSLEVHTHSSELGSPSGAPTLFPTTPLPAPISGAAFSYSAIACDQPAPFNDTALVFRPEYPGIESPAAVRHFVEGSVTEPGPSGAGQVEGTITTYLCEDGELGDSIVIDFQARYRQASADLVRVVGGTFSIVGGTGRFEDLAGSGSIQGQFECLDPVLARAGAADCFELGVYSDANFSLNGTFSDPTA